MNSTSSYRREYEQLRRLVDNYLTRVMTGKTVGELSTGVRYVATGSGKRVRSTLLLLACKAVGGRTADALHAGAAVELMHNFTLVHDDIMDNAESRRGKPTVHRKWGINNALLVGDVLLGLAYRSLLKTKSKHIKHLASLMTEGLLEVCEGQALDLEFELRRNVSMEEYFRMIEKKTARLLSMSAELGGVIGGASKKQLGALRAFGHYLGRAFQVQDDLLDVVADERALGKLIGGDIIERKKTFLLVEALSRVRGSDRQILRRMFSNGTSNRMSERERTLRQQRVPLITSIYRKYGVLDSARHAIHRDTVKATNALASLPRNDATSMLHWFSDMLLKRVH
jgi:geranylgeranyl diphosphate synthase type II